VRCNATILRSLPTNDSGFLRLARARPRALAEEENELGIPQLGD
jgi:hypothetical protein